MTTSFYTPLVILSSGSNGKVGICLYYLLFGVEDKRLHLSFNRFGSDFLYPFLGCTVLTIY